MRHASTAVAYGAILTLTAGLLAASCGADDGRSPIASAEADESPGAPATEAPTATSTAPTSAATAPPNADPSTTPPVGTISPTTSPPPTTDPSDPSAEPALVFLTGGGVESGLPIGQWNGTTWTGADDALVASTSGGTATVVDLDRQTEVGMGDAVEACFDGRTGPSLDRRFGIPDPPGFGYSAVGSTGSWDLVPRSPRLVGLDAPEYQTIGEALARARGLPGDRGTVVQVVRTDLDGDGVEDVVVVFEHEQPDTIVGAPGDFSFVYARLPAADGSVDDVVLFASFVDPELGPDDFPFWQQARVMATVDLNGDGVMELVLRDWYYEGAGATVWELGDGGLTKVLEGGCGA